MQKHSVGLLTPGLRLFRNVDFNTKMLWIAGAFVLPLLIAFTVLLNDQLQQIRAAESELEGLSFIQPTLDYIRLAQERRGMAVNGATNLGEQEDKVREALKRVEQVNAQFSHSSELAENFKRVTALEADLARSGRSGSPDEVFARHSQLIESALILVREISDRSQLTLDPGLQTYHMINMSVVHGPLQIENVAQLRGLGTLTLRTAEKTPQRHDAIRDANAEFGVFDRYVENAFEEGVKPFPDVAKRVDMAGADAAAQAFREAVKAQLLGASLSGDPKVFWQLGTSAMDAMYRMNLQVFNAVTDELTKRRDNLRTSFLLEICAALMCLGLAMYLTICFHRTIVGGLNQVSLHLINITKGNLKGDIRPLGSDESAHLMSTLKEMQGSLQGLVHRIRSASDEIVHTSSEIASGAMDLSARTEQTAANLEESASAMEEISSTVKNTADHTQSASDVARHNAEVAAHGGSAMKNVVATMDGIRDSSARIGEIIGTIDAIAFQTNILALNAAVEAARAGEAGRGFAVVASEVRTLAQRSAGAAREIKELINTSVDQVEAGTSVVRTAGSTIEEIVDSSQRVDQLLGEITTSAREQSQGVAQIGLAINELDRMTQQNAALVEETAAAAAAMKDQASTLVEAIAHYQLPAAAQTGLLVAPSSVDGFDFDQAIEAHRHWKVRLRKAIANQEHLDAATICKDDQCPLGKWIHGPGGSTWGTKPTFVDLAERHAEFHQAAGQVAQVINDRAFENAERLIGSGSRFAQLSSEVATLLTRAKRGI